MSASDPRYEKAIGRVSEMRKRVSIQHQRIEPFADRAKRLRRIGE